MRKAKYPILRLAATTQAVIASRSRERSVAGSEAISKPQGGDCFGTKPVPRNDK